MPQQYGNSKGEGQEVAGRHGIPNAIEPPEQWIDISQLNIDLFQIFLRIEIGLYL
jgi:hypothetical protein